jgi:general secretion pathway protein G
MNEDFKMKKMQSGFTLIEIMVVVVILGILASIVVPKIMSRPDQARIVRAQQDITSIENALNLYRLDNGSYPTTDQGLRALVQQPSGARNWSPGGYLKQVPIDPWNNQYQYVSPGSHSEIDIYSYGPEGVSGGENGSGVIGNWNIS